MGISINTNIAASRASHFLASNHANLQKSLDRLSSGRRITEPADDAGGLAVAMKMKHSIQGLSGASKNIGNAISFLQVQDGILSSAGDIVSRMGELKGLYGDVLKSTTDKATYDAEFQDLQGQLFNLALTEFNGIRLVGDLNNAAGAGTASTGNGFEFGNATNEADSSVTLNVSTSENGSSGPQVALMQSLLLSAVTITQDTTALTYVTRTGGWDDNASKAAAVGGVAQDGSFSLASSDTTNAAKVFSLADVQQGVFSAALENVATARAKNGGQVKRLQYAQADVDSKMTNMTAAHGRIMDVDIAAESSNLAKQQILVQAAAAMTAQANSANDVALMLLR